MSDQRAQATAETAKTAGKAIELVRDAGSYLAKTIGDIPPDLVGLAGDWLHEVRRRNAGRLQAKTAAILDRIDRARWTEPSPSVVVPLLEAAADESSEELGDLWAALLANAMIDNGRLIRREFFALLKAMEPIDALMLDVASRTPSSGDFRKHLCRAEVEGLGRQPASVGVPQAYGQWPDHEHRSSPGAWMCFRCRVQSSRLVSGRLAMEAYPLAVSLRYQSRPERRLLMRLQHCARRKGHTRPIRRPVPFRVWLGPTLGEPRRA